jgi:hypothetical protein
MSASGAQRLGTVTVLSEARRTYLHLIEMTVRLERRPVSTIHEADLRERLGVGRRRSYERLQRLTNDAWPRLCLRRARSLANFCDARGAGTGSFAPPGASSVAV